MISWADLLTLLFASMAVLYASAARNSFTSAPVQAAVAPAVNQLTTPYERLTQSLSDEIATGQLKISLTVQGIVVSLKDPSYFTSGSDEIQPDALESIAKIASVIRELPNPVRLEGHSDSIPIHNQKFRDNWSLSAARSAAVLAVLESRFQVPSRRLAIAAYADNRPASENESAEGRAQNRRVDIVILGDLR
jgi:chemotaxis protein MotB